jgi:indole-3-glycerol phosphate synthase
MTSTAPSGEFLDRILERKRVEIARRKRHGKRLAALIEAAGEPQDRGTFAIQRLRRAGADAVPKVIAEIKRRSPSAGEIRKRELGDIARIARGYAAGGASAVSVLCDGPGFGGSVLDLRRATRAIDVPVLFKEFVLDSLQIELARVSGAHMVLLLVRALTPEALHALVGEAHAAGLAPVVEAADEHELSVALATDATIVGVNARDLRTFRVDPAYARRVLDVIPSERVAVLMSGITSAEQLAALAGSRADAVLVGEGLMRASDPGARLRSWLDEARAGSSAPLR